MKDGLHFRANISQLMDTVDRMSESELARQTDLPQQTIHRLLSGATPDPRISTLQPIAKYFNVTLGQLVGSEPLLPNQLNSEARTQQRYMQIPLLSWEHLANLSDMLLTVSKSNWLDWTITNASVSEKAYALRIDDKSLEEPFSYKTIITVDLALDPKDNDILVVYDKESDAGMLKRLVVEGKKRFVRSLKTGIAPVELSESLIFCGVVVRTLSILREE